MHKSNDPDVLWIRAGLEFQLSGSAKTLSLGQLSYFCHLHDNSNVRQEPAAVFATQDLRLHAIQSDSYIDIGIVCVGIAISFYARSKNIWIPGINGHLADGYGNFRSGSSLLNDFVDLLQIVGGRFAGSIHDELGSVCVL